MLSNILVVLHLSVPETGQRVAVQLPRLVQRKALLHRDTLTV